MTTERLENARREYVLDTNILIHDPRSIFAFQEHDVVIPMTVLEELDKIKDSPSSKYSEIKSDVRYAIQLISKVLEEGGTQKLTDVGSPLGEKMGNLRVLNDLNLPEDQIQSLDQSVPDNRIIGATLFLQMNASPLVTVLVTKDINLRLKAVAAGVLHVEDYMNDQMIADSDILPTGYIEIPLNFFDSFSNVSSKIFPGKGTIISAHVDDFPEDVFQELFVNCHLYNEEQSYRVTGIVDGVVYMLNKSMSQLMKRNVFGIQPKNHGQAMAIDALMDPDVSLVILAGPAGSGKSLLAIAAAIEQSAVTNNAVYNGIVFTRLTMPVGEEIGFLPGSEEEKMAPWLGALHDSLEFLCTPHSDVTDGNSSDKLDLQASNSVSMGMVIQKAGITLRSSTFLRGRSFSSKFIILDEMQNATRHHLKTFVTRAGPGTKICILGNNAQIDNPRLTPSNSAISIAIEKFKAFDGAGSFILEGGVRSPLSAFAEDNL